MGTIAVGPRRVELSTSAGELGAEIALHSFVTDARVVELVGHSVAGARSLGTQTEGLPRARSVQTVRPRVMSCGVQHVGSLVPAATAALCEGAAISVLLNARAPAVERALFENTLETVWWGSEGVRGAGGASTEARGGRLSLADAGDHFSAHSAGPVARVAPFALGGGSFVASAQTAPDVLALWEGKQQTRPSHLCRLPSAACCLGVCIVRGDSPVDVTEGGTPALANVCVVAGLALGHVVAWWPSEEEEADLVSPLATAHAGAVRGLTLRGARALSWGEDARALLWELVQPARPTGWAPTVALRLTCPDSLFPLAITAVASNVCIVYEASTAGVRAEETPTQGPPTEFLSSTLKEAGSEHECTVWVGTAYGQLLEVPLPSWLDAPAGIASGEVLCRLAPGAATMDALLSVEHCPAAPHVLLLVGARGWTLFDAKARAPLLRRADAGTGGTWLAAPVPAFAVARTDGSLALWAPTHALGKPLLTHRASHASLACVQQALILGGEHGTPSGGATDAPAVPAVALPPLSLANIVNGRYDVPHKDQLPACLTVGVRPLLAVGDRAARVRLFAPPTLKGTENDLFAKLLARAATAAEPPPESDLIRQLQAAAEEWGPAVRPISARERGA